MKKITYIKLVVTIIIFQLFTFTANAQMTAPEDPGGEPGDETPIGGGAPLSEGTLILIILGAVYGSKKVFELRNEAHS